MSEVEQRSPAAWLATVAKALAVVALLLVPTYWLIGGREPPEPVSPEWALEDHAASFAGIVAFERAWSSRGRSTTYRLTGRTTVPADEAVAALEASGFERLDPDLHDIPPPPVRALPEWTLPPGRVEGLRLRAEPKLAGFRPYVFIHAASGRVLVRRQL